MQRNLLCNIITFPEAKYQTIDDLGDTMVFLLYIKASEIK